ncbi:uncharacterized protein LOC117646772 isoform X5 [Thrips palmi]|uniref:Uncharacterized protein LOC117646772 isoform X5 n=1 Tax=Thrips palmi TaxID=161013 RepID=A0A6P8Z1L7_THRPL|nr:uncharacterized protein LOC117646772 isoform X5 [Thrips palmi]
MRVDFSVPSSLPTATASPECATLTTIQGPGFGCRRDNQWQCRDGRCIDARRRCDLNRDCNDASDEDSDTCTSVPTLIMNVGDTVLARMKHKENYHGVRFLMCSNDSCSCLTVSGEGSSGLLALVAKAECNSKGVLSKRGFSYRHIGLQTSQDRIYATSSHTRIQGFLRPNRSGLQCPEHSTRLLAERHACGIQSRIESVRNDDQG